VESPPHHLCSLFLPSLRAGEERSEFVHPRLNEGGCLANAQHRPRAFAVLCHRVAPFRVVMRVVRVFRGFISPLLSSLPGAPAPSGHKNKTGGPVAGTAGVVPTLAAGLRQSMTLRAR
jgi:hypothetical protein